jgi:predicted N-formylglutamate amidohydrolase
MSYTSRADTIARAADHAADALVMLKPQPYEGDDLDTYQSAQIDALRAIALAVLALRADLIAGNIGVLTVEQA